MILKMRVKLTSTRESHLSRVPHKLDLFYLTRALGLYQTVPNCSASIKKKSRKKSQIKSPHRSWNISNMRLYTMFHQYPCHDQKKIQKKSNKNPKKIFKNTEKDHQINHPIDHGLLAMRDCIQCSTSTPVMIKKKIQKKSNKNQKKI